MEIKIDLNEYLTEEEKKEICTEEFRKIARESIYGEYGHKPQLRVMLGNVGYEVIAKELEKTYGINSEKLQEELAKKVFQIINEKSAISFLFFENDRRSGLGNGYRSPAVKYIEDELLPEMKPLIKEQVEKAIKNYNYVFYGLKDEIGDCIYEAIMKRLTEKGD